MRVYEGKVTSEPRAIARLVEQRTPDLARIGLESGPTSVWLVHALQAEGLPVICLNPDPDRRADLAGVRIWIASGHTDMRRGMRGLALQVHLPNIRISASLASG